MIKKFISGIVFGSGFSVAALSIYTIWMLYFLPPIFNLDLGSKANSISNIEKKSVYSYTPDFHELPVDEMIKQATAILTVRYEPGEDGFYKSVVEDVLKKEEGVELYYLPGEIYEENTHHKIADGHDPERGIVFMQGNPASMRFSTTFSGERIRGLGGITLSLIREKCNDA